MNGLGWANKFLRLGWVKILLTRSCRVGLYWPTYPIQPLHSLHGRATQANQRPKTKLKKEEP